MKIQCSCGAKYAFDVTPEMAQTPIKFVCPNCGLDSSDAVNEMIRRELAAGTENAGAAAIPIAPPPTESPRLKISRAEQPTETSAESAPETQFCSRHIHERVTDHCVVCGKPICPKCMALFGYVCSPLCKAKAEAQKIRVPVYARQAHLVEKRFWRMVSWISGAAAALLVAAVGFWFWYAWFGSVPHPILSVQFDESSDSGSSQLVGQDQFVFLHGGSLARYDLKIKKQVWSDELVTPREIKDETAQEDQLGGFGRGVTEDMKRDMVGRELENELSLFVSGQNIWVADADKLTHYDWDSGKVLQAVTLPENRGEIISRGDELVMLNPDAAGAQLVTYINLTDGESQTKEFRESGATAIVSAQGTGNSATGGLPLSPGADNRKPLNPQKVAEQAQNLSSPERIALPALLANSEYEQKIEAELNDKETQKSETAQQKVETGEHFTIIPSPYGNVQFTVRLLEKNIVTREAMEAPPQKSALDTGNIGLANETEAVNEQLNEMQRSRGGGTVSEDESRYQVTIRLPDSTEVWTGDVIGPPTLHPLKTVNVLTAGKTVIVFDKSNKKLWQTTLTYDVPENGSEPGVEKTEYGEGPCVEHGDTLYVFDQAVLTAFDLATGEARWRIPTVGVLGLFFDDKNMLYVNTTSGNPNNIKYSRQIDITQKIEATVLKIDPANGKILWSINPGAPICYLSGKFIYAAQAHVVSKEEQRTADLAGITPNPSYIQIWRINPKNGRVMWEYYHPRAPIDVQFNDNFISIVFKKEVQVLKYLTL